MRLKEGISNIDGVEFFRLVFFGIGDIIIWYIGNRF